MPDTKLWKAKGLSLVKGKSDTIVNVNSCPLPANLPFLRRCTASFVTEFIKLYGNIAIIECWNALINPLDSLVASPVMASLITALGLTVDWSVLFCSWPMTCWFWLTSRKLSNWQRKTPLVSGKQRYLFKYSLKLKEWERCTCFSSLLTLSGRSSGNVSWMNQVAIDISISIIDYMLLALGAVTLCLLSMNNTLISQ